MNQLQESIRLSISDIKSKGIELVFSTYHNPGEGEFKIMEDIKKLPISKDPHQIIIVSDDAEKSL